MYRSYKNMKPFQDPNASFKDKLVGAKNHFTTYNKLPQGAKDFISNPELPSQEIKTFVDKNKQKFGPILEQIPGLKEKLDGIVPPKSLAATPPASPPPPKPVYELPQSNM